MLVSSFDRIVATCEGSVTKAKRASTRVCSTATKVSMGSLRSTVAGRYKGREQNTPSSSKWAVGFPSFLNVATAISGWKCLRSSLSMLNP